MGIYSHQYLGCCRYVVTAKGKGGGVGIYSHQPRGRTYTSAQAVVLYANSQHACGNIFPHFYKFCKHFRKKPIENIDF